MLMLTVRNPWARAMFRGPAPKDVENRVWPTKVRGRIGIHCASALDRPRYGHGANFDVARRAEDERDRSKVIGSVLLKSVHLQDDATCRQMGCRANPWAMFADLAAGERPLYHWELGSPHEYVTPIPSKGALKFWEPGPTLASLMVPAELDSLDQAGPRFS